MADLSQFTLTPKDSDTLQAVFQAEADTYLAWKRAVTKRDEFVKELRERHLKQREAQENANNKAT